MIHLFIRIEQMNDADQSDLASLVTMCDRIGLIDPFKSVSDRNGFAMIIKIRVSPIHELFTFVIIPETYLESCCLQHP